MEKGDGGTCTGRRGQGKEWEEAVKRKNEGSEKGPKFFFFFEKQPLSWVFKKIKNKSDSNDGSCKSLGPGGRGG